MSHNTGMIASLVLGAGLLAAALPVGADDDGTAAPANRLVVVKPPIPSFPQSALDRGLSGSCTVTIDVSEGGAKVSVTDMQCSDDVFSGPSMRAVMKAEYTVQDVAGAAEPGVVYGAKQVVRFRLQ